MAPSAVDTLTRTKIYVISNSLISAPLFFFSSNFKRFIHKRRLTLSFSDLKLGILFPASQTLATYFALLAVHNMFTRSLAHRPRVHRTVYSHDGHKIIVLS